MIPAALESNVTGSSNDGRVGTTVTAGASIHTTGSWSTLIASTGTDAEGIYIKVVGVGSSNVSSSMLMDIGTGTLGSETVLIPDLLVGYAGSDRTVGRTYFFPLAISSGTRISARCQSVIPSDTAEVAIWLAQDIQHLEGSPSVVSIGEVTASSKGTVVASGTNQWTTWTNIGSVSSDVNCLMPGVDASPDTQLPSLDDQWLLKLGYGTSAPGSGGTEIDAVWYFVADSGEYVNGVFPNTPIYADIPSGDNIYVNINGNDSGEVKTVVVQAMECPVRGGSVVVPSDTLRQSITIKSSGPTDITVSQDSSKPALEITP